MGNSANPPGMLIVPQGAHPVPDTFIDFLLQNELGAYLAKPTWAREKETGETGLGVRVAPGSC